MFKKQIEGITKTLNEPGEIYFGNHKSEFFKTNSGSIVLFNANGTFFIEFKDKDEIDYIIKHFKLYDKELVNYNSIVERVKEWTKDSTKLYDDVNYNWFKSRKTYDKNDRKIIDLLDEGTDIIMNYSYITRIFEITRGKFSFNFSGSLEPVIFENKNYYVCLMPIERV